MTSEQFRAFPPLKPTSGINLNDPIFSGKPLKFLKKPSRDDIYKKMLKPKDLNESRFKQKGLSFVWPQKRRSSFYNKELVWATWMLAHALYWLHVIDVWPSGAAVPFKQPPWRYQPPLHRPKSRDFIIEPDWGSEH